MDILADAFEESESAAVKTAIVTALRRAFPQVAREADDSGFVQACRRWYIDRQEDLTFNREYAGNMMAGIREGEPLYTEK